MATENPEREFLDAACDFGGAAGEIGRADIHLFDIMHIGAPLPAALVVPRPIALVGPDSIVNAGEKFTLKRQSFAEWRTEIGANAAAERAEPWS